MANSNECEAVEVYPGAWVAKYGGAELRNKHGNVRQFKSERAAMKAAYFARDGKDYRPEWRRRGRSKPPWSRF